MCMYVLSLNHSLFQTTMAYPGSIVLSEVDPTVQHGYPYHLFTSLGGQFDSNLCITPVPFTIVPNEGHVLITDLDQICGAVLQTGDGRQGPLSIDGGQSPLQLCYGVRLKSPDMMLHVGKDTCLSLLLRAGCLQVTPFMATKEQVNQMIRPFDHARPTPVDAAAAAAAANEREDEQFHLIVPHASPFQPVNGDDADDNNDDDNINVTDL